MARFSQQRECLRTVIRNWCLCFAGINVPKRHMRAFACFAVWHDQWCGMSLTHCDAIKMKSPAFQPGFSASLFDVIASFLARVSEPGALQFIHIIGCSFIKTRDNDHRKPEQEWHRIFSSYRSVTCSSRLAASAVYNAAIWRVFRVFIEQIYRIIICRRRVVCVRKRGGSGDAVVKIALHVVLFNTIVAMNLASPVFAQGSGSADVPGVTGFKSPSDNIHCQYFDGASDKPPRANVVRCDIKAISNSLPRRPKDCDLEWGQAFGIDDRAGPAQRLCYGDTVVDPRLPVLQYGAGWERGGVSCKSEKSGVSCVNANGNGFELSRNAQRLF